MRPLTFFILIILTLSSIFCGVDLIEEGKKAFLNGDYTQAINFLSEAQEEDSSNHTYNDLICLAYLYRGEELYNKTRNVKAFDGNFAEAKKYLPHHPTLEFNKKFGKMLLSLARAYHTTKPKNDEEKEFNFENAVKRVKQAIAIDSTNQDAHSMLAQLKKDHFQNF